MNKIYIKIANLLNSGAERSIKAKKNVLTSFFLKSASISINLLLVPLTINYVTVSEYGVWLTLSSIVAWFSFFDIGLTNGLRNKFAEAISYNDTEKARVYVSTTFAILTVIISIVWIVFMVFNSIIDWNKILNLEPTSTNNISIVMIIVFTYFCLQFVLKIINTVLIANQEPAMSSLIDVISQSITLIIIFIMTQITTGSLYNLALAMSLAPFAVLVFANIFLFNTKYKQYKPNFKYVNFKYAKGLFNLGLVFFIIQIAGIIQYQSANFIIINYYDASNVVNYNIVYKYFSMLSMVYAIFLTPFWTASTDAYFRNDIEWIKNAIKRYKQLNILVAIVSVFMLFFSDYVYMLWLGENSLSISFILSFWAFVYFNLNMYAAKYVSFLNGIGALRIQFISSLISPVLFIVIVLLFFRVFNLGIYSIFIASIFSNFNGFIIAPLQYHMIVNKSKRGIWVK